MQSVQRTQRLCRVFRTTHRLPTHLTSPAGGAGLPHRVVTDFEVIQPGAGGALQPLDALGPATVGQLVLSGQLVAADAGGGGGGAAAAFAAVPGFGGVGPQHAVTTGPLLDWVVDYSQGPAAAIWAVTEKAWYQLLLPSGRYAPLFASAQRKAALACAAAADAGAAANPSAAVERAAAAMGAGADTAAKQFALAQLHVRLRVVVWWH